MFRFTRRASFLQKSIAKLTTTPVVIPEQFISDYDSDDYCFQVSQDIKNGTFIPVGAVIGSAEKSKVSVDVCAPASGVFNANANATQFTFDPKVGNKVWTVGSIDENPPSFEHADEAFRQGISCLTNRQLARARSIFLFILKASPSTLPIVPYCYYNLGVTELWDGNRKDSYELFRQAQQYSTTNSTLSKHVSHALGLLKFLDGDVQGAKTYFQISKDCLGASEFAYTVADIYDTARKLDKAAAEEKLQQLQASFDRAVSLDPSLHHLCLNVQCEWERRLLPQYPNNIESHKPLTTLLSNTAVLLSPLKFDEPTQPSKGKESSNVPSRRMYHGRGVMEVDIKLVGHNILHCWRRNGNMIFVTGSGISKCPPTSLDTRQDLWRSERYDRDECVSAFKFHENPNHLWNLIHNFVGNRNTIPTNEAHIAIAKLSKFFNAPIITQNVDGLHAKASDALGYSNCSIQEIHGSLLNWRCSVCDGLSSVTWDHYHNIAQNVMQWTCWGCSNPKAKPRPDVVLFGEQTPPLLPVQITRDTTVIVAGTASDVHPVSSFVLAASRRCSVYEFTTEETRVSPYVLGTVLGKASETLPQLWDYIYKRAF